MKKMTLGFGRAASLSFLGMAAMSILTVHAQVTITTANGLWNSGVESDNVTLIPGNSNGQNNPADPHYTETYYIDGLFELLFWNSHNYGAGLCGISCSQFEHCRGILDSHDQQFAMDHVSG